MFSKFCRTALILVLLFVSVSCATRSVGNVEKSAKPVEEKISQEIAPEKKKEKTEKINVKKLAKEAGYMVAWDFVLAAACKAGLHLSVGVCLAADVVGDVGIIVYSNLESAEAAEVAKKPNEVVGEVKEQKVEGQKKSQDSSVAKTGELTTKKPKKKIVFDPLEFVMGVSLMALMLVLI